MSSSTAIRYVPVLLVAAVIYGISCAPGAVWQDSGLIQYRVWHNDIEGSLGLATSHPLYYIVAIGVKYLPLGAFGHRVNFLSALAGAVAAANLYLLVRLWLGRDFPAVIAAATLALSHTFWWHASVAETYTLWAALFLGELVCLLQYLRVRKVAYLYLLGLLNGMAIAVHMLGSISFVCYAVLILVLLLKKAVRPKDVAIVILLWGLGALPYEYLIVRNAIESGDLLDTLASAAFGARWRADVLNTSLSWKIVREDILLVAMNFPTPNILLFLAGCYSLVRIRPAAFRFVVVALLLLFLLFASRYTVADRYAFFIPFYSMVAAVIGLGAQEVVSRIRHKSVAYLIVVFSLLPAGVYAMAPQLAQRANLRIGTRQDIAYRNDYEYFLRPWRTGYRGAERFAAEALEGVESDAIIQADITTVPALLYVQEVKGLRPDVKVVSWIAATEGAPRVDEQTIDALLAECPIYVVSCMPGYCPKFILENYQLVKAGLLWRVTRGS